MTYFRKGIDPVEHAVDLTALHEMEELLPMTSEERKSLRNWVYSGHPPETNPWHYADADGWELNYLEAFRRRHGYMLKYRYIAIQ